MKPISFRLLGPAACLVALASGAACAPADEDSGSSADQVKLEGRDIATALTSLRAGEPFSPGLDETLIEIGSPCMDGVETKVTGGHVDTFAGVVQNRDALKRDMGIDVKLPIPHTPGLTGSIGIVSNTSFDRQSAHVLLQSAGTYTSEIKKLASEPPAFSAADVARCGYGYIRSAKHRVAAALVVTVRSNDEGKELHVTDAGAGNDVASVKANLHNIVKKGNLEISVRFASDVVPGLPDAPIGDAVIVVGTDEAAKQQALDKLNSALNWLGQAHTAIQNYLDNLANGVEMVAPAPTQSVRFQFYPSTPRSVRAALEKASENALGIRASLAESESMMEAWDQFAIDADRGIGYLWNVPGNPAGTVDEVKARRREMMDDGGGKLRVHHDRVEELLENCVQSLRNDEGNEDDGLMSTIGRQCTTAPGLPFDKKANELRQIVAASVTESTNDGTKCPTGYRKPLEEEHKLFGPWSRHLKSSVDMGIWTEKSGCKFSSGWIYDGAPGCTTFGTVKKGKTICVSSDKGPTSVE